MMNYETFKEHVKESLEGYLYGSCEGMKIEYRTIPKINCTLDSISLRRKTGENENHFASPTTYINDMYEDYCISGDVEAVLKSTATKFEKAMRNIPEDVTGIDIFTIKDNVELQLINTEQNKELLKNLPHREFLDLSIVYRWIIRQDKEDLISSLVNYQMMAMADLTEEQLYEHATRNMMSNNSLRIYTMKEIVMKEFKELDMPEEMIDSLISRVVEDTNMHTLTTKTRQYGAVAMLFTDLLQKVADKCDSDLYIIPSSTHEVLTVPTSEAEADELVKLVEVTNMEAVNLADRLSNQLYHYSRETRRVTLATDTPNKRLDELTA